MLARSLGAPTSLEARQIMVEQFRKNIIFFTNAAGAPGNHSYYLSFDDFETHVFSLYPHRCIYIPSHVHTVCLERLQAVLESNSR